MREEVGYGEQSPDRGVNVRDHDTCSRAHRPAAVLATGLTSDTHSRPPRLAQGCPHLTDDGAES